MSLSADQISFNNKVTWMIQNFEFYNKNNYEIIGPKFNVSCLDNLSMSFRLQTRRPNEGYMKFVVCLHPTGNSNVVRHINCIGYKVCVSAPYCETCFLKQGSWFLECPSTQLPPIEFIPVKSYISKLHLKRGSLVVVCKLTICVNRVKYQSSLYDKRLTALSDSLVEMRENTTGSDMLALSKERIRNEVHQCILRARCPILFREFLNTIDFANKKPIWYCNMSNQLLKTFLLYIYGKDEIEVPHNIKLDLMAEAKRYQLLDLEKKLQDDVHIMPNTIEVEDNFKELLSKIIRRSRIPCHGNRRQLKGKLKINHYKAYMTEVKGSSHEEGYIVPRFNYSNVGEGNPIFFKCTLCLEVGNKEYKRQEYTFPHVKSESIPPFLTNAELHKYQNCPLKFQVLLREMSFDTTYESTPDSSCVLNDLSLIGKDLGELLENESSWDLIIKVGSQEFRVHRSFLENRNEIIKEKLKAFDDKRNRHTNCDDTATVILEDIEPQVCAAALAYLYSGRADLTDSWKASDFKHAIKYFDLPKSLFQELFD